MCDTVGYVPQSAMGREVRCANEACLVPIFIAKKIEQKAPEKTAEPAKKKRGPSFVTVLAVILLLGGGVVGYFYYQKLHAPTSLSAAAPDPEKIRQMQEIMKEAQAADNANTTVANANSNANTTPPGPDKGPGPGPNPPAQQPEVPANPPTKSLVFADVRDPVLALMSAAAQDQNAIRKEYCQRVTAQTAADCGDLPMARAALDRLPQGKAELVFYRVPPLASIAWQQLKKGDQAGATQTLDQALKTEADCPLPETGNFSVDTAAWLAAALVAAGRDQEARSLIQRFPASGAKGKLFAAMGFAAARKTWDVEAAQHDRPLWDVASLEWPVVIELAVAQGYPAEALRFAESAPGASLRTECQIAWADAVAFRNLQRNSSASVSIDPVIEKLLPTARARLQARLGILQLAANDRSGAEKSLAAALAVLGTVKAGEEFVLPSVKELYSSPLPDPAPARASALALAEMARLEGKLNKQEDARKHVALAMSVLRASVPSPVAVQERLSEAEGRGAAAVRNELRVALKLRNDNEARGPFEKYRQNCRKLLKEATSRFALQVEILNSAIDWDDPADLWKDVSQRATEGDSARKEPYFTTLVPWKLYVKSEQSGNKELAGTIYQAAKSNASPAAFLEVAIHQGIGKLEPRELIKQIEGVKDVERPDRERVILDGASRLLNAGKLDDALNFVRLFNDQVLREEVLQWTTALACRLGLDSKTNQLLRDANFVPTDSVSAWRGFLLGLQSSEEAKKHAPSASSASAAVQQAGQKNP